MGQNDRINRTHTHTQAHTRMSARTRIRTYVHTRMNLTKQYIKAKFVYKN